MESITAIAARNKGNLALENLEKYKQLGKGGDGAVFQISHNKCVKIFWKEKTQKLELEALKKGQSSPIIPRLYEYGSNYIVMEYVNGYNLKKYLKEKKRFSDSKIRQILYMLSELKRIGFLRHDTEVRHIYFNEKGEVKVIDHKRAFTTDRTYPRKLISGLEKLGYAEEFLQGVKQISPTIFNEWAKYYE
ncbi:kinase [Fictibacillus sp. S7]|uniref:kinase n=1 Tax=Fictibacillus sp. S7 TaxID=2212476 RepID=UPI0010133D20|nr:kinase [Fictibacillus sp. S7]RXZ01973.1 kinase [Fictibacillus sp. S7]